jgi:membrane-anchored mycosin MYCP
VGGFVDPTRPSVVRAIALAAAHDVVVVLGAPAKASGTAVPATPPGPAVVRVGAIGIDGAAGTAYQPGTVDVVAPGVDVASLGLNGTGQVQGTGTQYAVAFVAGEVALVRSMYPNLTAAQVIRRIEATADRMGAAAPDPLYGWGLIDPGVAVTRTIPDEGRRPDPAEAAAANRGSVLRTEALVVIAILALVLVILLALRVRRLVRAAPLPADAVGAAADTGTTPVGVAADTATAPVGVAAGRPAVTEAPAPVAPEAALPRWSGTIDVEAGTPTHADGPASGAAAAGQRSTSRHATAGREA